MFAGSTKKPVKRKRSESSMIENLFLKNEVKINGRHFDPEICRILHIAKETCPGTTDNAVWVTSANDGKHSRLSKHYSNEAFDLRIRNLTEGADAAARWATAMKQKLGEDYDVVYGDSAHLDHIHVEYDPKG